MRMDLSRAFHCHFFPRLRRFLVLVLESLKLARKILNLVYMFLVISDHNCSSNFYIGVGMAQYLFVDCHN